MAEIEASFSGAVVGGPAQVRAYVSAHRELVARTAPADAEELAYFGRRRLRAKSVLERFAALYARGVWPAAPTFLPLEPLRSYR